MVETWVEFVFRSEKPQLAWNERVRVAHEPESQLREGADLVWSMIMMRSVVVEKPSTGQSLGLVHSSNPYSNSGAAWGQSVYGLRARYPHRGEAV